MSTKWIFLLLHLAFICVLLLALPADSLAAQIRTPSNAAHEQVAALPPDVQEIVDQGILGQRTNCSAWYI